MNPTVLIYDPGGDLTGKVRPVFLKARVRMRAVRPEDADRTAGELASGKTDAAGKADASGKTDPAGKESLTARTAAGGRQENAGSGTDAGTEKGTILSDSKGTEAFSREPFDEPVLVFCYLTKSLFDQILRDLRKAGAGPEVIKAVLTPTNASWPFGALCRELARERDQMRRPQA